MKSQTPEQNIEKMKAVYEILGQPWPKESEMLILSMSICIDMDSHGCLSVSKTENLMPMSRVEN